MVCDLCPGGTVAHLHSIQEFSTRCQSPYGLYFLAYEYITARAYILIIILLSIISFDL